MDTYRRIASRNATARLSFIIWVIILAISVLATSLGSLAIMAKYYQNKTISNPKPKPTVFPKPTSIPKKVIKPTTPTVKTHGS